MRIALTGATGLLGRNLLFEILKQNLNNLNNLEILILYRPKDNTQASDRIEEIITNDGLDYLKANTDILPNILKSIHTISFDLLKDNLSISLNDFKVLMNGKISYFFHVAALTDFRSGKGIEQKLYDTNVAGTNRVINLIKSLNNIDETVYIGSAYSCGSKTGNVKPNYSNLNESFRNPYEKSKLEAELMFLDYMKNNNIRHKVFRPTTICGRLIESPLGSTNKYDVFYSWIAFFLREKFNIIGNINKIYTEPIDMPIRLHYSPVGGLNIIPADYAAKIIYNVCVNQDNDINYHLASHTITSNEFIGKEALRSLNINGATFVLEEPADKNRLEKLYYKTVGKIFIQYQIGEPILFDISNLSKFHKRSKLSCPEITKMNFSYLMEYGKHDYFGVKV